VSQNLVGVSIAIESGVNAENPAVGQNPDSGVAGLTRSCLQRNLSAGWLREIEPPRRIDLWDDCSQSTG
jgi:hypothetical protein